MRLAGVGAEYRPSHYFALDVKAGLVYANGMLHKAIGANDYFFNKGAGYMLTPKYYPGLKKRFYVGVNLAFYDYGYKNKVADGGINYDKYSLSIETRDRHTYSFAAGPTMGFMQNVGNINLELFVAAGLEYTSNVLNVYSGNYPTQPYPYSYNASAIQINGLAGIKIGFGFKRQHLYAKEYYIKKFRGLISAENIFVVKKYKLKIISREKLQEYYTLRNEQVHKILYTFRSAPHDTTQLNDLVDLGYKNITTYLNYVYGNH